MTSEALHHLTTFYVPQTACPITAASEYLHTPTHTDTCQYVYTIQQYTSSFTVQCPSIWHLFAAVLEVRQYGTVCHNGTSPHCLKPHHDFLSDKYRTRMPDMLGPSAAYQSCPQLAVKGTTLRYEGGLRNKQVFHRTNKQSWTSNGRDTVRRGGR